MPRFPTKATSAATSLTAGTLGIPAAAGEAMVWASTALGLGSGLLVQDVGAFAFTAVGSLAWVKMFRELTNTGVFEQKLSRKLVHISSGMLFLVGWSLFSAGDNARLFAASVPLLNGVRLLALGTGLWKDEAAVNSISREGCPGELLRGPLFYVIVMSLITVTFWRDSPIGITALSIMCGGDGLADIFGRRFGKVHKLPFNKAKSWAGSLAMLFGGLGLSCGFVSLYVWLGYIPCPDTVSMGVKLAVISLIGTVVEALPANRFVDDNISVPMVTLAAGMLLF